MTGSRKEEVVQGQGYAITIRTVIPIVITIESTVNNDFQLWPDVD